MKITLFLISWFILPFAFSSPKGVEFLTSCPLSSDIKELIQATGQKSDFIQHKIIRDIRTKIYQSYTNNEITPLSKERLTTGVSVRWEDIFGYTDREELYIAQGKSLVHGQRYRSKELVKKWVKFYFDWKWGRIYRKHIQSIAEFAKRKSEIDLGGLSHHIQKTRWASLQLRSEELLGIDKEYQTYFSNCTSVAVFRPEIEVDRRDVFDKVLTDNLDKDLKIFCDSERQRTRSQFHESYKKVKVNLGTSYGQNLQLGSEGRKFGEVRAMIDVEISLDSSDIPESRFDQCDFEIRQLKLESNQRKRNVISSVDLFDKNLSSINKMNKLLSSEHAWNSFPDAESLNLMMEYILSIEQLVKLDYDLSSELLASNVVDNL